MNLYKSLITIIIIFCSIFAVHADAPIVKAESNSTIHSATKKVDGGPRTVIQFMTSVEVIQPEATKLYITVVKPNGAILLKITSEKLKTTISTGGWTAGEYTIETTDDLGVYQEFIIEIQ